MRLPDPIDKCIQRLEAAGFAAYAVGGCVRDDLLGIAAHDYDLCTSALPEQTAEVFRDHRQIHAGIRHGTVGVIVDEEVVEITTFRTEGAYQDNRHPDWVEFVPDIEGDLARRDFTVNAIAWSPTRGYADPFGGRDDLKNGILRAVGQPEKRFQEDSLRILRGMRFAVRFGLTLDPKTEAAMVSQTPLMNNLARERVFSELCGFLPLAKAEDLQRFAPELAQVLPELTPTMGFQQHSPHHAYDVYTHTAHVFAAMPPELPLRWAALLHDIGKVSTFTRDSDGRGHFYGHAQAGAALADLALQRLKAPNALQEQVVWLISHHMDWLDREKKLLRRYLSRYGQQRLENLLILQEADMGGKGTQEHAGSDYFDRVRAILRELEEEEGQLSLKSLAVNGSDLQALGFRGKQIGSCLNHLLEQVIEETLPNEKAALLRAAVQMEETL